MIAALCWVGAFLAVVPALMIALNLRQFRRPEAPAVRQSVSVIVPARNEEAAIGPCVRDLLASTGVDLEVIVVDDHSEDGTASIVRGIAAADSRVRLCEAPALPRGWAGKQHACYSGALVARYPMLLFIDCDVRLVPGAVAAIGGFLAASGAPLVSGFPRERTSTIGEVLLIPLIHVLLLGYLPILRMRRSAHPSLGAGCGQIMLADAAIYRRIGGHAMIRRSWHDGVQLPRAFRRQGYRTDIFDASGLAECRMYQGFAETWRGLSKNAREGMATAVALPVWTVLLGGGLVMPFVLVPVVISAGVISAGVISAGGIAFGVLLGASSALLLARLAVAWRFRQSLLSVPLLPVGAVLLLVLQWRALLAGSRGRTQVWRGRTEVLE